MWASASVTLVPGLVADAEGAAGAAGRILLSIAVEDVDSLLSRVTALGGGVRPAEQHAIGTGVRAHRRPRWQHRQPHPAGLK